MDNLPIEISFFIFKNYLTINDLLNCRLVNKQFKSLSEDKKLIEELIISDDAIEELNEKKWFYSNKSINYLNSINYPLIKSLNLIYNLELNLKRFYLDCKRKDDLDFSLINSFHQLEELNLSIDFQIKYGQKYRIKLDQLKICKIKYFSEYGSSEYGSSEYDSEWLIRLKTPNLIALSCHDLVIISIKGLKKLKFLQLNYHFATKLPKLKHLEHFQCRRLTVLNDNFLSNFPNLKKLNVNFNHCDILFTDDEEYDRFKQSFKSVLDDKIKLKRLNLKIYLYYVEILNKDQLDEFSCNFEFLQRNIHLLDDYVPIKYIDYEQFINSLPETQLERENLYSIYFSKFKNITYFTSNQPIDNLDRFVWFLTKNKRIKCLSLYNSSLEQSFYDNLIDYLPKLKSLTIREGIELNFDFILNLKLLNDFTTNHAINSIDLIERMFNELKYLSNLDCKINKNWIIIRRIKEHNQYKFKLSSYSSIPIDNKYKIREIFNDLNECIDQLFLID